MSEPHTNKSKTEVELDLSNNATKSDLKNATAVNTSQFAKKCYLANLKSDVDKLDIDELKNEQNGLNSLESKVDKLNMGKLKSPQAHLKN